MLVFRLQVNDILLTICHGTLADVNILICDMKFVWANTAALALELGTTTLLHDRPESGLRGFIGLIKLLPICHVEHTLQFPEMIILTLEDP